jgi:hypothetical protein
LFLEARLPLGRFERRRLAPSGGTAELKSTVDIGAVTLPALRLWAPLLPWLAWGGELSGGFSSDQIDGARQITSTEVNLLAQLRVAPWHFAWGEPRLALGVGGTLVVGRFLDTNTQSTTMTAVLPAGSADLGALIWLWDQRAALDVMAGAGYAFGPAKLDTTGQSDAFLQRMVIELSLGVVAAF